jgi:hypothetical protein
MVDNDVVGESTYIYNVSKKVSGDLAGEDDHKPF